MEIKDKKIWCFAAHADDETLGCGGTLHKFSRTNIICTTAFTNGVGARYLKGDESIHKPIIAREGEKEEANERSKQFVEAMQVLGIESRTQFHLLDNMLDQYSTLAIAKRLEACIQGPVEPDVVFTHFRDDLNVDHQKISQASYVALRPQPGQKCKMILEYETPSSTEYSQYDFNPNVFVSLSDENIEAKINAFDKYDKEGRKYPHPRSPQSIVNRMAYWGSLVGEEYAEAFLCRRMII